MFDAESAPAVARRATRLRARWSIADQGLSSLGNFLLVIIVVTTSSIEDVGRFGLIYATYFLLLFVARGLAADPLVIRYAGVAPDRWRHVAAPAVGASGVLAVGMASVICVAVVFLDWSLGEGFLMLAVLLPGLLTQDAWRMAFYCLGRPRQAFWNDLVFLGLQVIGFLGLAIGTEVDVLHLVAVWGVTAYLCAGLASLQAKLLPSWRSAWTWLSDNRGCGPAYAGDYIANRGAEHVALAIVSALGGLGAAGAVTSCRSLFSPVAAMQTGVTAFALPEAARLRVEGSMHRLRVLVWLTTGAITMLVLLAGVALYGVPDGIGKAVFGDSWRPAHELIIPMTAFSIANALSFGVWIGLRGLQLARETFVARILSSVLLLGATSVGVFMWGSAGAVWGMTAGMVVQAVWFVYIFERQHRPARERHHKNRLRRGEVRTAYWATAVAVVTASLAVLLIWQPLFAGLGLVGVFGLVYFATDLTRALAVTLAVAALPIFVDPEKRSLTLLNIFRPGAEDAADPDTQVHVAFVLVAMAAVLIVLRGRPWRVRTPRPGQRIVVILFALFTVSITTGIQAGAGAVGFIFYAQTIVPLTAWFAAAHSGLSYRTTARIVMAAVVATLLLVFCYIFTHGGIERAYELSATVDSAIPQYRAFFPGLMACALAFAVARWSIDRPLSVAVVVACAIAVPFTWSRGGIAMMIIAAAVAFIARPGRMSSASRLLALGVGVIAGLVALPEALDRGVIGKRESTTDLTESDDTRLSLAVEAAKRILDRPLLGDRFLPHDSVLIGGVQAKFERLFPAHNQYLDYGLRGGVLAVILLIALLVLFGMRAWKLARTATDPDEAGYHAALLAVIVAVGFGNFFWLYVIQTWTGCVLMILLGVSAGFRAHRPRSPAALEPGGPGHRPTSIRRKVGAS
ncbi:O-antigen ligase family protein [Saccharopolyspora shandongensis]|uniref:O-antigen ligase family protein n=1 Tax=Saccharopolyspora shandongensis TaxID=418495 RepID=UPI0033CE358C